MDIDINQMMIEFVVRKGKAKNKIDGVGIQSRLVRIPVHISNILMHFGADLVVGKLQLHLGTLGIS